MQRLTFGVSKKYGLGFIEVNGRRTYFPGLFKSAESRGAYRRFVPQSHKTEHHDKQRTIVIGPEDQAILAKYLLRDSELFCFVPEESAASQRRKRTLARTTPLSCGDRAGPKRKLRRQRAPGDRYSNDTFRRAITRGCELAFGMPDELRKIPAKGKVDRGGTQATAKAGLRMANKECLAPAPTTPFVGNGSAGPFWL